MWPAIVESLRSGDTPEAVLNSAVGFQEARSLVHGTGKTLQSRGGIMSVLALESGLAGFGSSLPDGRPPLVPA